MQQKSNTAYKWRKIFAAKAYGGKEIKLTPIEAQELIDDIESEVKYSLGDVRQQGGLLVDFRNKIIDWHYVDFVPDEAIEYYIDHYIKIRQ